MQYIFSGRTGEKVSVRFDVKDPPLRFHLSDIEGQTCEAALLLSGSIDLAVSVTTEKPISDLATFRNQITTVCKGIYDAATFLNGVSLEVELNSLLEVETKRFWTFEDRVPELQQSAAQRPLEIQAFFTLAITDAYLRSALSDLNAAIKFPNDTGFYCYRAIETMMQHFKQPGGETKVAWQELRQALLVTKDWIEPLTTSSKFNRHGELKPLSGNERLLLMTRAWTLFYRFARLKLLNVVKLPTSDFPVLDK